MKKLVVLVSMAAVVAVLVAGLAGVFGKSDTPAVYASRLAGISSNGVTGVQVQNLDEQNDAQIVADFYEQKTGNKTTVNLPPTGPGAASTLFLPQIQDLKNGAYAAIISADRQIAAIANTVWTQSGGAALYSNVKPGTDVIVPLVAKKYYGQSAIVSIQNTDASTQATAEVSLYKQGEAAPIKTLTLSIPGGTSETLDLVRDVTNFGTVPDSFVGMMRITSATPIAAQAFIDFDNLPMAVYAFEGVPSDSASDQLFVPLFRRNYYGTTGISVVNPGSTDVQVTIRFTGTMGDCNGQNFSQGPATVPAGSSVVFYQGPNQPGGVQHDIPDMCGGSAVIEVTGGKVMAITNDGGGTTSAAYNAVAATEGAKTVALPLFRRAHVAEKMTTGIQAMNIGPSSATVTIVFKDDKNNTLNVGGDATKTIPSNGSYTWFPPNIAGIPDGTYGSATITSDQPLAVIVNDASARGVMDSSIYNGIKADVQ